MKKLLILLLFVGCTKEQLPENYKPIEIVFYGNNLTFFNELNQIRLSHNIPSLKGEKLLTDGCIQHSWYMFSLDTLNHDYFWSRYVNSKSKGFAEVICYGFINIS